MEQETFGATTYDRERRLKSGGYQIVTTLDVKTQEAAYKNIQKRIKNNSKNALMLAGLEPGTGRVRALAVNRVFKLDDPDKPQNKISSNPAKAKKGIRGTYPNTTNPLMTGGNDINGYQFGSTFKMFTMVAALEKGYPLQYTIDTVSPYKSNYIVESGSPAACPGTNKYCPENAGRKGYGVQNMWAGFGRSINTYFVPLQERVGAANVVDVAKKLGIQFRAQSDANFANNRAAADDWGAFTLGVSSATPLEMANAYATLIADGKYCEPIPVQQIVDQDGKKLDIANPRCEQRIKTEAARAAVDAARCPVGDSSSTSKCSGSTVRAAHDSIRKPIMGKTGTTDSAKTAALIVGTKQIAVAGIIADPDWAQTSTHFSHDEVNPAVYETVRDAMKGKPSQQFTPPGNKIVNGDQRSIPDVTCRSINEARSRIEGAGFEAKVDSTPIDSPCPANTAAGTSPDGRTIKGGVVIIQISNGKGTPQPGTTVTPGRPGRGGAILPPPPTSSPFPSAQTASWRRTSAATRAPSARPATAVWAAFIAGPICALPVTPAVDRACATSSASSASSSCLGR
ncbi:hypothetical protein Prum_044500 [Phytohabitans rumicis]|uniref:PASTA domain-containing protein n=1 Tax=Phytohabitans rumicis TaxID=1076125 RepID=A0A6V8L739_9ACTN|nr:hypothetical protein Prum_044500 [Phytohabitans rumicis]